MKISSWNINGYKSKLFGNKLCLSEFLHEVQVSELVGITETHAYDGMLENLEIPGFERVALKNKAMNINYRKGHGGIAVFVKEHLVKSITPINTKLDNTIWVKIKKEGLNRQDDIFLGTVYMNPHRSKVDDEQKINDLQEEIVNFQKRGQILLQGDLNARTCNENDFISPDKTIDFDFLNNNGDITLPARNSEDKVIDNRGKELLETCKSLNLVITNGRKPGDMYGKYTSIQWNGSSVVDYVISSHELFHEISTLFVGPFIPWVSDHCAIHYTIDSEKDKILNHKTKTEKESSPMQFLWDQDSKEKFTKAFNDMGNELNRIEN